MDVLVITNPDKDHIAGFIDVLEAYKVALVVEPGTISTSAVYSALKKAIDVSAERNGTKKIIARRGQTIDLGGGAVFKILFPDRDVSSWSTNDGSLIGRLEYASSSVMFTGDAPQKIEKYLVTIYEDALQSDILKAGHHGSRTSTSVEFVSTLKPLFAVISAGENNKYKHPHPETLSTLKKFGVPALVTSERGMIVFRTNGKHWREPVFVR